MKTERELPPLMTGDNYACKNFSYKDQIYSLHGGTFLTTLHRMKFVSLYYIQGAKNAGFCLNY